MGARGSAVAAVQLAGRLRRVHGKPFECRDRQELYCQAGGASPKTLLSGRVSRPLEETRHRIRRAFPLVRRALSATPPGSVMAAILNRWRRVLRRLPPANLRNASGLIRAG